MKCIYTEKQQLLRVKANISKCLEVFFYSKFVCESRRNAKLMMNSHNLRQDNIWEVMYLT